VSAITYFHCITLCLGQTIGGRRGGLSGLWAFSPGERFVVEEVGFQACEHFFQVRVCWELFPGSLGISFTAMRLLFWLVAEALEGK
jgi:hypothetical protein